MRARAAIILGAIAIGALALAQMALRDRVLLNSSPSVPTGLYIRVDDPAALGSFVTVRAVDVAPGYASSRGFTDAGDRFIKRVAAMEGATVCAEGAVATVGALEVPRQSHDSSGRVLPSWSGCHVLEENELFLMGDTSDSFDSRYFGIVTVSDIEGVWRPL